MNNGSACVCANGYYQVPNASAPLGGWQCNRCLVGYACAGNAAMPCAAGTFANALGSSVCAICQAGTYSNASGMTRCYNCSAGSYSNASGSSACSTCAIGQIPTPRFACPANSGYGDAACNCRVNGTCVCSGGSIATPTTRLYPVSGFADAGCGGGAVSKTWDGTGQNQNGAYATYPYCLSSTCAVPMKLQYDMGSVVQMSAVTVVAYWGDTRKYCSIFISVSTTGAFSGEETKFQLCTTWASCGYITSAGNTVVFPQQGVRYIQWGFGGSDIGGGAYFLQMYAYASAPCPAVAGSFIGSASCVNCQPGSKALSGDSVCSTCATNQVIADNKCQCAPGYVGDTGAVGEETISVVRKCGVTGDQLCPWTILQGVGEMTSYPISALFGNTCVGLIDLTIEVVKIQFDLGAVYQSGLIISFIPGQHESAPVCTKCCATRTNNMQVSVGTTTSNSVPCYNTGIISNTDTPAASFYQTWINTSACSNYSVRYVTFQSSGATHFTMGKLDFFIKSNRGCAPCPAGRYCLGDVVSYPCPIGTYSNKTGSTACVQCEPGTFGNAVGLSSCLTCSANQIISNNQCQCAPGFMGDTNVLAFSGAGLVNVLRMCGADLKQQCPYTITVGSEPSYPVSNLFTPSTDCNGMITNSNALFAFRIDLGTIYSSGLIVSFIPGQMWGPGTYPSCTFCCGTRSNGFTVSVGTTTSNGAVCYDAGTITNVDSQSASFFSKWISTSACSNYPVRYVTITNAALNNFALSKLDLNIQAPPVSCGTCPANYFCPGGFANYSIPCLNGTYSVPGSSSFSQCVCPVNAYYNGTNCTCNAGYYKVSNSSLALAGWQCVLCPNGSACANDTRSVCANGTYSSAAGLTACSVCSSGSFSLVNASACVKCPAGSFASANGADQCVACGAGTFANATGKTECEGCSAGFFSATAGSSTCAECAVGTFANTTASSSCPGCAANTYASAAGSAECVQCPDLSFSPPFSNTSLACTCAANFFMSP